MAQGQNFIKVEEMGRVVHITRLKRQEPIRKTL